MILPACIVIPSEAELEARSSAVDDGNKPEPTCYLRANCHRKTGQFVLEQKWTDGVWRPVEGVFE